MSRQVNILFLGGAKRVSLAGFLIEAGNKRGMKIKIYSYELTKEVPIACVGEVIPGLKWGDPLLYEHLSDVLHKKEIHIVLPFVDPAIEVAAKLKELHEDLFIPSSPLGLCRIMFDKRLSDEWFRLHGIAVPDSYEENSPIEYPVILKPRTGSASKGIRVIYNEEEMKKIARLEDYLIQEYIAEHEEYTVDCYVSCEGRIIAAVPRIRLETAGGEVITTRTIKDRELMQLAEKILNAADFSGAVTIQLIKNKLTGALYAMEINPRLGGGVIAAIAAGADISQFIVDEFAGKILEPVFDWKADTLMTRYFKEVIFYADNH